MKLEGKASIQKFSNTSPAPSPGRGLVERDTAGQPRAVTVWLHLQLPLMGYQQWPQYQYKAANMLGGSIF